MKTFHQTQNTEAAMHVLVEEEEAIRKKWLQIACAKDIPLMTYPDAEWFLSDLAKGLVRSQDRYYLDQDFGSTRGVGVRLAREIKAVWPEAYTCLVTAYPRFLFRREIAQKIVDDVFGKYPAPFDNPAFTQFEEKYEREIWSPHLSGFGGCNG